MRAAAPRDVTPDLLLLKVPEAAKALGIGRATLYRLIDAGQIEAVHIGRSVRIPHDALIGYVERLRGEQAD